MKSAKIKKTFPAIDLAALNLPLLEMRKIIENIKEAADQLEVKKNIVCTSNWVVGLSKALVDLLQFYKDKKVTLLYLQEILAKLFPRGSDISVKRVTVLSLSELGIIPDVIIAGDCEEFKTLLAIGDRTAFQTVMFEYENPSHTGLYSTCSYHLLSFTLCYGSSSMVKILDGKGYQPLLLDLSPAVPFADPVAIMLSRNEKPDEIMKRCCLFVQGMNAPKKRQFFEVIAAGGTYLHSPSPLYSALYKGKEYDGIAKFLLRIGADVGQVWCDTHNGQEYFPMELILYHDRVDLLPCISERDLQVLMKKDLLGLTVFQWAIRFFSKKCISYFLKKDMVTDIDTKVGDLQYTALMRAAWYGDSNLVNILLKKGARLDETDVNGYTALAFAVYAEISQSLPTVKLPLPHEDKSDQECLISRQTPLHLAAVRRRYNDMIRLLLQWGASLDKCALNGNTPVDIAMQYHSYDTINLFVDVGANLYECRQGRLSLAFYLFYYRRELFERLCAVNKIDLNQRNKEGGCFWNYLNRYDNMQIGYLSGEIQGLVGDPPIQEVVDGDSIVHDDSIGSTIKPVGHEALQTKVLSELLVTGQQRVAEEAVLIGLESIHQSEKEMEAYIRAQNAELTRERKQRRRQQRAMPLAEQETEYEREQSQVLNSTSLRVSSPNVSPIPDQGLERSEVVDAHLSLIFAVYPLEKKDQKVYEGPKSAKACRSKWKKPLKFKEDVSLLTNFHVNLPSQMEPPATVLVCSYSRVVDTIAHLHALVMLDGCAALPANLIPLAVLGHILTLAKFCCSVRGRDPLCQSVKLTKIIALRDLITDSYRLPSEKDILSATQTFVAELPSDDPSFNLLTLITLFRKNVCFSLFSFYSQKQDLMDREQDFLACYQAIYDAFRMLQANYPLGRGSYAYKLNPAAAILFIAAHALRKALKLNSKNDDSFQAQRDSLAKDECLDWGEGTFSSVMRRGKLLMDELHYRFVGLCQPIVEDSPQSGQSSREIFPLLPQSLSPEDLNSSYDQGEKAVPLYKLWEGSSIPLLFRLEKPEDLRTGCGLLEKQQAL